MKKIVWSTLQGASALWIFLIIAVGIKHISERDGEVYALLSIVAIIILAYSLVDENQRSFR